MPIFYGILQDQEYIFVRRATAPDQDKAVAIMKKPDASLVVLRQQEMLMLGESWQSLHEGEVRKISI